MKLNQTDIGKKVFVKEEFFQGACTFTGFEKFNGFDCVAFSTREIYSDGREASILFVPELIEVSEFVS